MSRTSSSGSVLGGILLIGGSCLGAGMLALPIQTGASGLFPSLGMFLICCLFMTTTALLLVEVNGWFPHRANLLTMTKDTLGKTGKHVCWSTYLFLFYALLVAYISGCGSLVKTICFNAFAADVPAWWGSLFFVLLFGVLAYLGTKKVDYFNRVLMVGKIGFFLLIVAVGFQYIHVPLLLRSEPEHVFSSLPLLVIAFGFHNIIPSLTAYLNGNKRRVKITILGGSLFACVIYFIWEILVLGIIPLEGENGLLWNLSHDKEASQALASYLHTSLTQVFSQGLGFFALLTSFLAQTLSLVHFLSDALKINYRRRENIAMCALALLPPLLFSLIYPNLFFKALNFAGGICAVVLFGILPVLMVWIGRYRKKLPSTARGGKPVLVATLLFALLIFSIQVVSMFS